MKRLLRWGPIQQGLAILVWLYALLLRATLRWRLEGYEAADFALKAGEGAVGLCWHGRLGQAMASTPLLRNRPTRVLISLSRDGAFIAKAAARLGMGTIRGSAGKAGEFRAKGGAAAFREALASIGLGEAVIITADGPRGPPRQLPIGPVALAKAAGCKVFLIGFAARPAIALKSWDQARLPLPFARAAMAVEGPFHADGETALEAVRAAWEARLRAVEARAEALLGDARATSQAELRGAPRGSV